ncbi:PleD family two-component system response regulator [Planctomycetota bacterium]
MGKAKVLIIDDDPDITEAMRIILENKQYDVDNAEGSQHAFELIKDNKPDVIILDVMMDTPQDGFVLSRQLKQDANYKDIPILMLTAVKDKIGIDFESVAGDETWLPVDEYMQKPVKPDMLLEKLAGLLNKP